MHFRKFSREILLILMYIYESVYVREKFLSANTLNKKKCFALYSLKNLTNYDQKTNCFLLCALSLDEFYYHKKF